MKWKRTEFGLAVVVSAMMPSMAVAADRIANLPTAPVSQSATALTNQFSNWSGQWTNLTVKTKCPPWGCSYTYTMVFNTEERPARSRELLETFAKVRREAEEMRRVQERLKPQDLAEKYRVRFGK